VRTAGERVESLLDDVRAAGDPRAVQAAEELARTLVDLYGEGLSHVVRILAEDADNAEGRDAGAPLLDQLVADPLVESLLLVHDLHPVDVDTRVQRALDSVRPYLGSHAGGVQYQGIDADGMVRLTLEGSCHGCPSSAVTVQLAIERAVQEAAPETAGVLVEGLVEPAPTQGLLQIGRRPPDPDPYESRSPDAPAATVDRDGWARLPASPLGHTTPRVVTVADTAVLVCRINGDLYAYRDGCPHCGSSLGRGAIASDALRCPRCGHSYNIRLAGTGVDDPGQHLDPLPLLDDEAGVRIAIGAPV
jgi:Fe-S cluster biogenesis protein NfuA/nitrite reductase/ring-hydroxylating ferredoxin subunit